MSISFYTGFATLVYQMNVSFCCTSFYNAGKIYFYCQVSETGEEKGIKKLLSAGYQAGKNHVFDGQLQFYLPEENRIHFTVSGKIFAQTKVQKVRAQSKPTDEVGDYEIQVVSKNTLIDSLLDHQDLVY